MPTFVHFITREGETVFVDASHITILREHPEGTAIFTAGGHSLVVEEKIGEVRRDIEGAMSGPC